MIKAQPPLVDARWRRSSSIAPRAVPGDVVNLDAVCGAHRVSSSKTKDAPTEKPLRGRLSAIQAFATKTDALIRRTAGQVIWPAPGARTPARWAVSLNPRTTQPASPTTSMLMEPFSAPLNAKGLDAVAMCSR